MQSNVYIAGDSAGPLPWGVWQQLQHHIYLRIPDQVYANSCGMYKPSPHQSATGLTMAQRSDDDDASAAADVATNAVPLAGTSGAAVA